MQTPDCYPEVHGSNKIQDSVRTIESSRKETHNLCIKPDLFLPGLGWYGLEGLSMIACFFKKRVANHKF